MDLDDVSKADGGGERRNGQLLRVVSFPSFLMIFVHLLASKCICIM